MKHRIVTEDRNDEDVIEWRLASQDGYPCVLARKSGYTEWNIVAYPTLDASHPIKYVVNEPVLKRLGFSGVQIA